LREADQASARDLAGLNRGSFERMIAQPPFLPLSLAEARDLGVDQLDVILVSGDAYVDHPSFGAALIGRVLWDAGYTVGIIDQPDWRDNLDFLRLGEPRLLFGVTSGNVDSMVNNYTASLRRRGADVYSPGGALRRPDRAVIVYANKIHALFPSSPLVLGGIEASLRRFAHYDYWSDSVRRSILADAPADMVVYGMGELALLEVLRRLDGGEAIEEVRDVAGTTVKLSVGEWRSFDREGLVVLPGFPEVSEKRLYARAFAMHYNEQDPFQGRGIVQPHPKTVILQNPPARPLTVEEIDRIYEQPFRRDQHPSYSEAVPALEPVRFSLTSHRGCFGSCSFCSLTHHQGRIIQSRSIESLVREASSLRRIPGFKGIIQDVGGPTANMYGLDCPRWKTGACLDRSCIDCPSLEAGNDRQVELLRRLRAVPGVRKVFIGSGIRYDLALRDDGCYIEEICRHHVSGHLKIAPEHISRRVTDCMRKPPVEVLLAFMDRFREASRAAGKEQYLVPYLISGHPGCGIEDMIELALWLKDHGIRPEQVQDFTPTPLTLSSAMYYTGLDPLTMEEVHVSKGHEKRMQRALLQFYNPRNYGLVREALKAAGREDLIGPGGLIPEGRRRQG